MNSSSALYTKAKLQHLKPEVWQGFAEDLNRTQRYNLIFIPNGSFGHLINFDSVKKSMIKVFNRSLSPDEGALTLCMSVGNNADNNDKDI